MVFSYLKNLIFSNNNKIKLSDQLIVVTGASSGIGLGIANEFAKKGCKVILIGRNENKLKNIIENIKIEFGNEKCYYICSDLTKEEDFKNCKQEIENISNKFGQYVEILVNCAGSGTWKYIEDTSFKECNELISSSYSITFNMISSLLKPMLLNGDGTIVIINTPVSSVPIGGCVGYSCSKWAIRGLTECLKFDLSGTGINILEVIGGEINTDYFQNNNINDDQFPIIRKYLPKISIDQISKATISAIENRKQRITQPFELNFLLFLNFYPFSNLFKYFLKSEKSKNYLKSIKLEQLQLKKQQQLK
ncbi:hypothetical protein ACTFIR_004285 [Dictyostelium discoideum]